jgi:hypothetical protein
LPARWNAYANANGYSDGIGYANSDGFGDGNALRNAHLHARRQSGAVDAGRSSGD